MLGVLVKDGNNVVDKQVYAGDDKRSKEIIENFKKEHPTYKVEVFSDAEPDFDKLFTSVGMLPQPHKRHDEWVKAKAKGVDAALECLAKFVGLE